MSIAVKILGSPPILSIKSIEALDFCFCGIDCYDSIYETAFVSNSGESRESDKSSFLLRKLADSDTITFQIWKGNVKVADILDSSFGTYYPTFAAQPLYTGVIIDWRLVAAAFGNGYYQIKADRTLLGQSNTFVSRNYWVVPYNERLANGTVRLETFTTGNILASEFNYSDLIPGGWYQSIRLDGRCGNVTPTLVIDKESNSNRDVISVQDSLEKEYTLFTEYLPESFKKQLVNDQLLNNRAIINDYNLLNDEEIRDLEVYLFDISGVNHVQRGTSYEFTFKDKINNIVLRNY